LYSGFLAAAESTKGSTLSMYGANSGPKAPAIRAHEAIM
jgi:hypothetical protein